MTRMMKVYVVYSPEDPPCSAFSTRGAAEAHAALSAFALRVKEIDLDPAVCSAEHYTEEEEAAYRAALERNGL